MYPLVQVEVTNLRVERVNVNRPARLAIDLHPSMRYLIFFHSVDHWSRVMRNRLSLFIMPSRDRDSKLRLFVM